MLKDLLEQAENSEAPVRAAALLRIARVESAIDSGAARSTFARGLDAIRQLPSPDGEILLEQAAFIAGAVAPVLLNGPSALAPPHMFEHTLLEVMLDHGHLEHAVSRVMHHENNPQFPFGMAQDIILRVPDESTKIALLRRAIEAWLDAPPYDDVQPPDNDFVQLFQAEWNRLPPSEALIVVREIVRVTLEQPERPMTASYADGAVNLTSWRAHVFFEILHILQHLDPELAKRLIAGNAKLAKAARRFPKGRKSMEEEAESRRQERRSPGAGGHVLVGSPEDFPIWNRCIKHLSTETSGLRSIMR
jgi:hypothetical protein